MLADAFFTAGRGHLVAQDYALASPANADAPWAVVCDGCSGSPHTDVGARLLAHVVAGQLADGDVDVVRAGAAAGQLAAGLGLPNRALDATCLVVRTCGDAVDVRLWGDGVVAWADVTGEVGVLVVEYPSGAPAYPTYDLDPERGAAWRDGEHDRFVVRRHVGDGAWDVVSRGRGTAAPLRLPRDELRWVLVGSDGLTAVHTRDAGLGRGPVAVPVAELVGELTRFATAQGRPLARRARRVCGRIAQRRGWTLTDDLSVAALVAEEPVP